MTLTYQHLHAICIAEALFLEPIRDLLTVQQWQCRRLLDNVLCAQGTHSLYFIFQNGAIISWIDAAGAQESLPDLTAHARQPYSIIDPENFSVSYGDISQIKGNKVCLANDQLDDQLTIAYALSEAVKVNQYEKQLDQLANNLKTVTANLEKYGKITLSGRDVLKKMGAIFLVRSAINLHSDLLDTPDFFWERPQLEIIYEQILKELDLLSRIDTLNNRLNTIQDLYSLLSSQLEYRHGFLLESVVVLLIALEILTTVGVALWTGGLH